MQTPPPDPDPAPQHHFSTVTCSFEAWNPCMAPPPPGKWAHETTFSGHWTPAPCEPQGWPQSPALRRTCVLLPASQYPLGRLQGHVPTAFGPSWSWGGS